MTTIQTILLKYLTLGYDTIRIEYYGGGDTGGIENIIAIKDENGPEYTIDKKEYEYVEEYFYDKLASLIDGDWINNEGGRGSCDINTSTGEYSLETDIYFTSSEHISNSGTLSDLE